MKILSFVQIILMGTVYHATVCFGPKTFLGIRPQGLYLFTDIVSVERFITQYNTDTLRTFFSLVPTYRRSFNGDRLATYFFGSNSFRCTGSHAIDRLPTDLLADYFGLPIDYMSALTVSPTITNFLMDCSWYASWDSALGTFFTRLHVPITHSKWDIKLTECVINEGTTFSPAGYLSSARINRPQLQRSFKTFLEGLRAVGDVRSPLRFGKNFGRQNGNFVADLNCMGGWNIVQSPWYYGGIVGYVTFPTGNQITNQFFVQPVIGNGRHWELGAGFVGFVSPWQSCDGTHSFNLYGQTYAGHLFNARQKRSYDFCVQGPGSRYALLAEIGPQSQNLFVDGPSINPSAYQYTSGLAQAINLTTLTTTVAVDVQADVTIVGSYHYKNVDISCGYDFWVRSKEKIVCRDRFPDNRYVFKGDAQLYGFDVLTQAPIALSASDNGAHITGGTPPGNSTFINNNSDNAQPAWDRTGPLNQLNNSDAAALAIVQEQVQTSVNPIFLSDCDINEDSALQARGLTHLIFLVTENFPTFGSHQTPNIRGHAAKLHSPGSASTTILIVFAMVYILFLRKIPNFRRHKSGTVSIQSVFIVLL